MPLALVTGAARPVGLGAAIAARLRADGWEVVTSDLADADYPCDLSSPTAPGELIDTVARDRGRISGLVLSHAHDVESGILDTTAESFDAHVAVNARASLLLVAAFARQIPPGGGAIVALTSDHTAGNLPYGASKGALDRITLAAAKEFAPLGISANALNPGPVDTGWMDDGIRAHLTAQQPGARLGEPSRCRRVAAFLLSDGHWVTGQVPHADGGFSTRA